MSVECGSPVARATNCISQSLRLGPPLPLPAFARPPIRVAILAINLEANSQTAIFETIGAGLKANPAAAKKVRARWRRPPRAIPSARAILSRATIRRAIL